MKFEVSILGSSSATPVFQRHPTSQLLNIHETYILIDCGEGTQMQLLKYGLKASRIDYILISHLHGDHYLGIIGLLSSLNLNGRKGELCLCGPAGLLDLIDLNFKLSGTQLNYPLRFIETSMCRELIIESHTFFVETIPLHHSINCTGFKITEKKRFRHVPNSALHQEAPAPRSYAFFSDTAYSPHLAPTIAHVNTLYHEATFLSDLESKAVSTAHSTAAQAALMALEAKVETLLLGHFSARYRDLGPLLDEARTIFPSSKLALEGMSFEV